mmetsp:Transcript_21084/g.20240  ORF Transcript_21084/g.20240 Transcript_21084/m.20240 type:complete len:182 (+) Transcript_21084:1275-1820(+)
MRQYNTNAKQESSRIGIFTNVARHYPQVIKNKFMHNPNVVSLSKPTLQDWDESRKLSVSSFSRGDRKGEQEESVNDEELAEEKKEGVIQKVQDNVTNYSQIFQNSSFEQRNLNQDVLPGRVKMHSPAYRDSTSNNIYQDDFTQVNQVFTVREILDDINNTGSNEDQSSLMTSHPLENLTTC